MCKNTFLGTFQKNCLQWYDYTTWGPLWRTGIIYIAWHNYVYWIWPRVCSQQQGFGILHQWREFNHPMTRGWCSKSKHVLQPCMLASTACGCSVVFVVQWPLVLQQHAHCIVALWNGCGEPHPSFSFDLPTQTQEVQCIHLIPLPPSYPPPSLKQLSWGSFECKGVPPPSFISLKSFGCVKVQSTTSNSTLMLWNASFWF